MITGMFTTPGTWELDGDELGLLADDSEDGVPAVVEVSSDNKTLTLQHSDEMRVVITFSRNR